MNQTTGAAGDTMGGTAGGTDKRYSACPCPQNVSQPDDSGRLELLLSHLLWAGVALSLALMVIGTALAFAQYPELLRARARAHPFLSGVAHAPRTLADMLSGVLALRGEALVLLGLIALIATPAVRVLATLLDFARRRDWFFALMTALVLALMLLSFALGQSR